MKNNFTKLIIPAIAVIILLAATMMKQCGASQQTASVQSSAVQQNEAQQPGQTQAGAVLQQAAVKVTEDGKYTSKEEVAAYINEFNHLPDNYITKTKAKKLGWNQDEESLSDVLPGMSIGGGPFNNSEGLLPEEAGRKYKECDIDYKSGPRNGKRIVYSNDGLIYYTGDHYETFERLY